MPWCEGLASWELGSGVAPSLAGPWKDENAKTAVAMARRLANRNPYEDRAWKYLMYLSMGIFGLLVAWALIFSYPCGWWMDSSIPACSNDRPTIFLLFWIAAFIGTGLRAAKRAADEQSERVSISDIFVEGAVGLSVSFGLSLIYMAGLFLAADNSDLFPLLSNKEGDFRRTAVLMSTISFTSAFLLEGSLLSFKINSANAFLTKTVTATPPIPSPIPTTSIPLHPSSPSTPPPSADNTAPRRSNAWRCSRRRGRPITRPTDRSRRRTR